MGPAQVPGTAGGDVSGMEQYELQEDELPDNRPSRRWLRSDISDEEFERLRGEISGAFAGRPENAVRAVVDEAVEAARKHRAET